MVTSGLLDTQWYALKREVWGYGRVQHPLGLSRRASKGVPF
ncbi:hypothetical protein ACQKP3_04500 [Vibrio sp. DNB22_10_4]